MDYFRWLLRGVATSIHRQVKARQDGQNRLPGHSWSFEFKKYCFDRIIAVCIVGLAILTFISFSFMFSITPNRVIWASLFVESSAAIREQSEVKPNHEFSLQDSRKQLVANIKVLRHAIKRNMSNRDVEWTDGNEGLGNVGIILLAILAELLVVGLAGVLAYTMGSAGLAIALGIVATAAIVFFTVKWIKRRNKRKMEKAKSETKVEREE